MNLLGSQHGLEGWGHEQEVDSNARVEIQLRKGCTQVSLKRHNELESAVPSKIRKMFDAARGLADCWRFLGLSAAGRSRRSARSVAEPLPKPIVVSRRAANHAVEAPLSRYSCESGGRVVSERWPCKAWETS